MRGFLPGMLVAMVCVGSLGAQCEEEARLVRAAESVVARAKSLHSVAENVLEGYELLAKFGGVSKDRVEQAEQALDEAQADINVAEGAVNSAQKRLDGCEEDENRDSGEMVDALPKLVLSIDYRPSQADPDRDRRGGDEAAPIEISVMGEPGFTYELLQSHDLIDWQSVSLAAYLEASEMLKWDVTLASGIDDRKNLRRPPFFRLAIAAGDTTEGGGRVRGRSASP